MGQRLGVHLHKKKQLDIGTSKETPKALPVDESKEPITTTSVQQSYNDVPTLGAASPAARPVPQRPSFPSAFQGELTHKLRARMSGVPDMVVSAEDSVPGETSSTTFECSPVQVVSPDLTGMHHKLAVGRQRNRRPPSRGSTSKLPTSTESPEITSDLDDTFFNSSSSASTPFGASKLESIHEEPLESKMPLDLTSAPSTPLISQTKTQSPTESEFVSEEMASHTHKFVSEGLEPKVHSPTFDHNREEPVDNLSPTSTTSPIQSKPSQIQTPKESELNALEQNERIRSTSCSSPDETMPPVKPKRPVSLSNPQQPGSPRSSEVRGSLIKEQDKATSNGTTSTSSPLSPRSERHSSTASGNVPEIMNGKSENSTDDLGSVSDRASVFGAHLHSPKSPTDSSRVHPRLRTSLNSTNDHSPGTNKRSSKVFDLVKNFENQA